MKIQFGGKKGKESDPAGQTNLVQEKKDPFATDFPGLSEKARNGILKAVRLTTGIELEAVNGIGYKDKQGNLIKDANIGSYLLGLFQNNTDDAVATKGEDFGPEERIGVTEIGKLAHVLLIPDDFGWSYSKDGSGAEYSDHSAQDMLWDIFHPVSE